MSSILDITAVLLVGGMGTRLRSVLPAAPKPLGLSWQPFLSRITGPATPIPRDPPLSDVLGVSG